MYCLHSVSLDTETQANDRLFERNGATVIVDAVSMDFLAGAEVDFIENLSGAYFTINNPNATSQCGCGTSFAV